jgi:selenocysteine-specific elongation factor
MDVLIEWLDDRVIPEGRSEFQFHLGTTEITSQCKVLAKGPQSYARLWFPHPVLALPGDRFVLRRPSPARTVGGGGVIDPFPPLRLNRIRTIERLERLANADDPMRIELLVSEASTGRRLDELLRATGLVPERIRELVVANPRLLFIEAHSLVVTKAWLGEQRHRLTNWLATFHLNNPSLPGAPIAQARLGLRPELASVVFDRFPAIRVQGETVALATHTAAFSDQDSRAMSRIERIFRDAGFHPPSPSEVIGSALQDSQKARSLLEILVKSKRLIRVSEGLVFHADVMDHVRKSLAAHRGRKFSVPEFKEWTQMSRKYAIPLLEYLDRERITRREGDQRVVL